MEHTVWRKQMKTLAITKFYASYKKLLKSIPDEGIMLLYNTKPAFLLLPVNSTRIKKLTDPIVAEAEKIINTLKIDTFTEQEMPTPTTLGLCSRCGVQGPVEKSKYLVESSGTVETGFVCKDGCLDLREGKRRKLKSTSLNKAKSVVVEQSHNSQENLSDFGPSNKHGSF